METIHTISNIITYSGIIQGFFLAIMIVTGKEKNRNAGIILGILLSLFSAIIIHSLFLAHRFTSPLVFREPFITLLCPFLYFYVIEIDRGLRLRVSMLGHFALFALFFIFQASLRIDTFRAFTTEHGKVFSAIMLGSMLIQFGFYIYQVNRISHVHDRKIADEFSHIDEMSLSWIRSFMLIISVIFLVMLGSLFLVVHVNYRPDYNQILAVVCSFSVYVLGFRGMRQRSAFVGRGNTSNVGNPDWEESSSEQDLVLGETVSFKMVEHVPPPSPDLVDKIRLFMKERKPHLDPEITLSAMANELGIGRNTLSYAINSGFKMNFFTFINNHRVEEVIAMLDDPDKKDENLLRIGYDAGFNSKATFNHIFKKYTGFTPKEYKLGKKGTNPDV